MLSITSCITQSTEIKQEPTLDVSRSIIPLFLKKDYEYLVFKSKLLLSERKISHRQDLMRVDRIGVFRDRSIARIPAEEAACLSIFSFCGSDFGIALAEQLTIP